MKVLAKIVIVLLGLSLVGLVFSIHLNRTLSDPKKIDSALKDSGSYDYVGDQIVTQIHAEIDKSAAEESKERLKTATREAVTPESVSKMLLPPLSVLVEWINNGSGGLPPLTIDTTELNQTITTLSQAGLTQTEQAQLKFELTRLLPEKIDLNQQTPEQTTTDTGGLNNIADLYGKTKGALMAQIGIVVFLLLLLIFMSLTNKRLMARRPAWAFALAAVVTALLSAPLSYVLRHTLLAQKDSGGAIVDNQQVLEIAKGLTNHLLAGLLPYAIILGVVAAAGFGLSMFLPKPKKAK